MGGRAWSQEELIRLARRINRNISARHGSQEAEPVGIKHQIQTLRKGEKQWQKLRSGREAKTKPEASC